MAENDSWVDPQQARKLSDELHSWFRDRAEQEARMVAPKAIEYGSRSMVEQGRGLDALRGNPGSIPSDKEAFELAVWDMVRLKVGRWTEAVLNGKPVSDDTLLDIGIYVKMAQRNRSAGSWPGIQTPADKAAAAAEAVTAATVTTNPPLADSLKPRHHTRRINSEWNLAHRGGIPGNQGTASTVSQYDVVSKHDGRTASQLVRDIAPDGSWYNAKYPDPHCSGYHNDDGHCLRHAHSTDQVKPKLPMKEL